VKPIDPAKICLLITVYHPYRWMAPLTWELLEKYWPNHPPVFFCGLTSGEAGSLPHIPCRDGRLPRVWAEFALEAARHLESQGFDLTYFLLEDHPPVGPCHERHLHETLPRLMNELPASYIGLLGWDNRRHPPGGGPIGEPYRFMHLTGEKAPRFHLHPSLFRTSALVACLDAVNRSPKPNPWGFEKLCDKPGADLPEEDKQACYQICGEELALEKPDAATRLARAGERLFFHRAMSLFPPLHKVGLGMKFWEFLGFDDFFYNGPFPLFYSGVMARGKISPPFLRYLEKRDDPAFANLLQAAQERGAR